ncbi:MAG: hypothetical protein ACK508_02700, partial [Lysobacteraceae bacterium]
MTRADSASRTSPAFRRGLVLMLAAGLAGVAFVLIVRPSNDRDWMPDQARMPIATMAGDELRLANVRNARYRSTTDFDLRWEARDHRLDDVESAWFI